ncbi:MAG TPA: hypothetical protein VIV61_06080 [Candidatus Ozemobacteraceae bacterium]
MVKKERSRIPVMLEGPQNELVEFRGNEVRWGFRQAGGKEGWWQLGRGMGSGRDFEKEEGRAAWRGDPGPPEDPVGLLLLGITGKGVGLPEYGGFRGR